MTGRTAFLTWVMAGGAWLGVLGPVHAQTLSDDALGRVRFEQKLYQPVSPTLPFLDETGRQVRLGQYFGQKPVLLVLGYYECPMLCTLVLNGLVESAADLKWSIGRDYEVVDISIDPQEGPALATAKKRAYLKRYGRSGATDGWHFLTGTDAAIREVAGEVGFRYAYDPASKQYAHPSGLVVLTPGGRVSRYLFGVTFSPADLNEALRGAASNRVSSPIQQFILLCFHYNPITGKYSREIMQLLRGFGVATVLVFLGYILTLVRQGRARSLASVASAAAAGPLVPEPAASPKPEPAVSLKPPDVAGVDMPAAGL
jgi:protein SCO1